MSGGSFLVDTNVLVYAYDRTEPRKQIRAHEVLNNLVLAGTGVLTTQVLGEFFWVVTRKLRQTFTLRQAFERVEKYLESWRVLAVTPEILLEAARGAAEFNMPYYDAQIWASAKLNQIPIVLSEDFSNGRRIEGVQFLNPFVTPIPQEG
jgi:predicted nucleic acid-binding protein